MIYVQLSFKFINFLIHIHNKFENFFPFLFVLEAELNFNTSHPSSSLPSTSAARITLLTIEGNFSANIFFYLLKFERRRGVLSMRPISLS